MPTGTLTGSLGPTTIADNATTTRSFLINASPRRVTRITIDLVTLQHNFPDDLDFLLPGPDGRNLLFWSDAGGATGVNATDTISDTGASPLPDSGPTPPAPTGRPRTSAGRRIWFMDGLGVTGAGSAGSFNPGPEGHVIA